MSITYVIVFDVIPEKLDQFGDLLTGVLDAMKSELKLHEAILHRDPDCRTRFMLYETWESHEDVLTVQLQRPYRKAWHAALPALLQKPRDVTTWQAVRVDRRAEVPGKNEVDELRGPKFS